MLLPDKEINGSWSVIQEITRVLHALSNDKIKSMFQIVFLRIFSSHIVFQAT